MAQGINIQWFPGHMTKARRMIAENLKLVDAVCEITDARIPASSRNPDLDAILGEKPRMLILNRSDQADLDTTKKWAAYFRRRGLVTLEADSRSGRGASVFPGAVRSLLYEKLERDRRRGQTGRTLRVMVVGIPNVGKSTFINKIAKRKAAAASDRPGVTRGRQWISVDPGLELLDTPGILWPKFNDQTVAENLAFTGAVRDEILDIEALGASLMSRLEAHYPGRLRERYGLSPEPDETGFALLARAARARGFILRGGEYDTRRMALVLLDEFRGGKLGRLTLEAPPDMESDGESMGD